MHMAVLRNARDVFCRINIALLYFRSSASESCKVGHKVQEARACECTSVIGVTLFIRELETGSVDLVCL